jgi:hypothetical protein
MIIMVDVETARQIALSLPGTIEQDHFGMPSFRVNKRIFATLWVNENKMMVKLPLIHQSAFHAFDPEIFYPVPNKYGLTGSTLVELSKVQREMLEDAVSLAWNKVTAKK